MALQGFGGFNQANQAALLQQQIADHQQAQQIFAQIARSQQQQQLQIGSLGPGHTVARPPVQGQDLGEIQSGRQQLNTFQQTCLMLNMLAQMMQAMNLVSRGFSFFMGGENPIQGGAR